VREGVLSCVCGVWGGDEEEEVEREKKHIRTCRTRESSLIEAIKETQISTFVEISFLKSPEYEVRRERREVERHVADSLSKDVARGTREKT